MLNYSFYNLPMHVIYSKQVFTNRECLILATVNIENSIDVLHKSVLVG